MPAVSCIASPNPDPIPVRPTIIKQCYSKNDCNAAVVVVVIVVMVVVRTVVVVVVVVRSILSAVPRVVSSPADRQGSPGLFLHDSVYVHGHYYAKKKKEYIQEYAAQFIARYNIS